jgi:chaperonin GroES
MKFAGAATLLLVLEGALAFTSKPAFTRPSTQCHSTVEGIRVSGEVKPTNNFILVKVADELEQTDAGILISGAAKVKRTEGKVVDVGPGKSLPETGELLEIPVVAGEGVVYGKFDGTALDIDGVKHTLIRDNDILVKFTGDELTLESAEVIRDNVLVEFEFQESTEGGLLLAKSSDSSSKPSTGIVVKLGPGRFEGREMDVALGDTVKFRDFAGSELTIEGKEYSVVQMADILAKF